MVYSNKWITESYFYSKGITIVFIECEDCDTVNTAKIDEATEYGEEKENNGRNIPTGMFSEKQ